MKRIGLCLIAISLVALSAFSQIITIPSDFATIQAGINAAVDGDTVLVEEGTYIENINFRGKAITVTSQFILDGDTSHISQTIIDGSQPEHDTAGSVVTMLLASDTTSVLCGFTIQGGTGTGPTTNYYFIPPITELKGAGILMAGGKIIHNIIRNNHIEHAGMPAGGGICSGVSNFLEPGQEVNQVIRFNRICHNSVHSTVDFSGGAGIATEISSGITVIEGNVVHDNASSTDVEYKAMSGGIAITRATLNNKATAIIRNNHIYNNKALSVESFGAGLFYTLYYTGPVDEFIPSLIYNNIIESNHSTLFGGGICTWYLDRDFRQAPIDPVIMNNTIVDNVAQIGVGLTSIQSHVALYNNIFQNKLEPGGTEIFDTFWNSPNYAVSVNNAITYAAFNNIQGGYPGIGNINQDPMLDQEDFMLSEGSPCIGRATDSVLLAYTWHHAPQSDFNGLNRLMASADMEIDMGALESPYERPKTDYDSDQIINVPEEESTIQAGIDAAVDGDTILVDEGVYYENINFNGKAITVASRFILDMDTTHIAQTVIDGSMAADPQNASVVKFDNCIDTTSVISGFTITGGKGTREPIMDLYGTSGGGIRIFNAGAKVVYNIVTGNNIVEDDADWAIGAGIGVENIIEKKFNVVIRNNWISDNHTVSESSSFGAGFGSHIVTGSLLIDNNNIYNNSSTNHGTYKALGAGIHAEKGYGTDTRIIISNNFVHHNQVICPASMGGGIYLVYFRDEARENLASNVPVRIYNNIIADNYSEDKGGGLGIWNMAPIYGFSQKVPDPIVSNNTIINNSASDGSGIFNYDAETVLLNNILWNPLNRDTDREIFNEDVNYGSNWTKNRNDGIIRSFYNTFRQALLPEDLLTSAYNSYMDLLLDSGSPFNLPENSPAIGRGIDSLEIKGTWYHTPRLDYFGNIRPGSVDTYVDPGAIESAFERNLLSTADLVSIDMTDTKLIPPFQSHKLKYILRMPENFDYVNGLIAIPEDCLAEMEVNHAEDIFSENIDDRTTTIKVTSSDATASKIYQVEFRPLSTDASLSELSVSQGSLDPEFDPGIFTYEVLLPNGTTEVPTISYLTSNESATVEVTDAQDLTHSIAAYRTSHVEVTAQDERTVVRYKIVFRVAGVGIEELNNADGLHLFPNPFSTTATLEWKAERSVQRIELLNMLGKIVREINKIDGNTLTLIRGDLPSGLYFLKVHGDKTSVMKVLID